MKKFPFYIFLLFLLLPASSQAHKLVVRDGTFRLLKEKPRLDTQLAGKSGRKRGAVLYPRSKSFQVYNFASGVYKYMPAVLAGEGKHCRIFTEKKRPHPWGEDTKVKVRQIINTFDEIVYPTVISWFGEIIVPERFPLEDDKIFIFLTDIQDNFKEGYVAGYFDYRDIGCLTGNQKPVFFMDTDPGKPGEPADKNNSFYRTLAHEFQHMVSYSRRLALGLEPQKRWLDEGLSMFSEFIYSGNVGKPGLCLPPSPHYERFIESPAVNLFSSSNNSWFKEDLLYRKYGASFLFVAYMIEKYGGKTIKERKNFTRTLIEYGNAGADGLDDFLVKRGKSLREVFANWIVACHLNDDTLNAGKWHFDSIKIFPEAETAQLPVALTRHYFDGVSGSFIGAEGEVEANSPNIDAISGKGNLALSFEFDAEMTPAIVLLTKDGAVEFSKPLVGEDRKFNGNYDLNQIDRIFLLPMILNSKLEENKKYSYSFKSNVNDLLLYPVANPAFPNQLIIFLRSLNKPLTATPTLNISFNNLLDSPGFYKLNQEGFLYAANYKLPGDGKGKAICHAGQNSCSFSFSSASIARKGNIRVNQGRFSLQVSSDKIKTNPEVMLSIPSNSNLPVSGNIIAGPCDVIFPRPSCATLSFNVPFDQEKGAGVCRINEKGKITSWQTAVKQNENCSALLQSPGRYLLVKDTRPPALMRFSVSNYGKQQLLKFVCKDDISGTNFDSLNVFYQDKKLSLTVLSQDDETISALHDGNLPQNSFIRVVFADRAGNVANELRKAVMAPLKVNMLNCSVFPNPCRREAVLNMNFNGTVRLKDSKIKIYDVSGIEVDCIEAVQKKSNQIQAKWRLIDKNGRRIANGIYFAKVILSTDKGQFKTEARLAVVR